jgi:hypothetical protein
LIQCQQQQKECSTIYQQVYVGQDSTLFSDHYIDSCSGTFVEEDITYNNKGKPRNITLYLDKNGKDSPRSFYHLHFNGSGEIVYIEKFYRDSSIKLKVLNDSLFQILKNHPLE